jgi:hypothetical protein
LQAATNFSVTPSTGSTDALSPSSSVSTDNVVGIPVGVVGGFLFLVIIVILAICLCRRCPLSKEKVKPRMMVPAEVGSVSGVSGTEPAADGGENLYSFTSPPGLA